MLLSGGLLRPVNATGKDGRVYEQEPMVRALGVGRQSGRHGELRGGVADENNAISRDWVNEGDTNELSKQPDAADCDVQRT